MRSTVVIDGTHFSRIAIDDVRRSFAFC